VFRLRKLGWHLSKVAQNKPGTMSQPGERAGVRQRERSGNQNEEQMSWKFPRWLASALVPYISDLENLHRILHLA
jgi:hypothetical protein